MDKMGASVQSDVGSRNGIGLNKSIVMPDPIFSYMSGTDLIVNGVLTVNENFQSGQFGIELTDLSSYPTNTGVPTGPFQRMREMNLERIAA